MRRAKVCRRWANRREDGTPVEFELRIENGAQLCSGRSGELLPSAELEPNTVYVIRVGARDDDQAPRVVFTTGTQRAATTVLDAPAVAVTFIAIEPDICAGHVKGCIGIEGAERAEVVLRAGSRKAVGLTEGPSLNPGAHGVDTDLHRRAGS